MHGGDFVALWWVYWVRAGRAESLGDAKEKGSFVAVSTA
jgi:hypothetical protein